MLKKKSFVIGLCACIVVAMTFTACKTTAKAEKAEKSKTFISWGDGGGFTGVETVYILHSTGEIDRMQGGTYVSGLKVIPENDAAQVFANAELLQLAERRFMQPGNTYKFIELRHGEDIRRFAWADSPRENGPKDLVQFHRRLMHLLK